MEKKRQFLSERQHDRNLFQVKSIDFWGNLGQIKAVRRRKTRFTTIALVHDVLDLNMMKKVPVFSNRLIFAVAAACVSQWLSAGVPGTVPGVPGTVPGVPGTVPGVPGTVPGVAGRVQAFPEHSGVPWGNPGGAEDGRAWRCSWWSAGGDTWGRSGRAASVNPRHKTPGWTPAMGPMNPNAALALLMVMDLGRSPTITAFRFVCWGK